MDLNQRNRLEESIHYYQKVLINEPEHATAHYNIGVTLKELGAFEQAITAYRHQLEIDPQHEKSWNNIGTTLTRLGAYTEAKHAFTKALEIDPIYLYALTNAAELALIEHDRLLCAHYIDEILILVGDQAEEFSVMSFFIWLSAVDEGYQSVLTAIEKRESKKPFNWGFETLTPVVSRLRKSQQKIAESFMSYFSNQLSFAGLEERLRND
ncbi:MAG: tetratricopeptide repeat protein, partial [Methylococcales bacterium]|nr:tetratricopeptide repeat protein [Methylococcales bacterium]